MNTLQLERFVVATSLEVTDDKQRMYIANCLSCKLGTAMRDCPHCKFNVGLQYKRPQPVTVNLEYPAALLDVRRAQFQFAAKCKKIERDLSSARGSVDRLMRGEPLTEAERQAQEANEYIARFGDVSEVSAGELSNNELR